MVACWVETVEFEVSSSILRNLTNWADQTQEIPTFDKLYAGWQNMYKIHCPTLSSFHKNIYLTMAMDIILHWISIRRSIEAMREQILFNSINFYPSNLLL